MSSSEKLCLKWDNFHNNTSSSFGHMRKDEHFSDVTLACDGDQKIEAHKVILAASSIFFDRLLKQNKHSHPLIYMRGLKAKDLKAIVDFIYHGEANIYQEDLDTFLALAEELQLKGLAQSGDESPVKKLDIHQKPKFKKSEGEINFQGEQASLTPSHKQ